MPDIYTSVVPIGVQRRLLLNLCGWRWDGAGYQCGRQYVSEEQLDTMSDEAWQTFVAPWLASAAS